MVADIKRSREPQPKNTTSFVGYALPQSNRNHANKSSIYPLRRQSYAFRAHTNQRLHRLSKHEHTTSASKQHSAKRRLGGCCTLKSYEILSPTQTHKDKYVCTTHRTRMGRTYQECYNVKIQRQAILRVKLHRVITMGAQQGGRAFTGLFKSSRLIRWQG